MNTTTIEPKDIPTNYEGLLARHMLRPIHDQIGYKNASTMIDVLSGLELNEDQSEYLDALSILVEAYEREQLAYRAEDETPRCGLELLHYLCAENGLSGASLAEVLGVCLHSILARECAGLGRN